MSHYSLAPLLTSLVLLLSVASVQANEKQEQALIRSMEEASASFGVPAPQLVLEHYLTLAHPPIELRMRADGGELRVDRWWLGSGSERFAAFLGTIGACWMKLEALDGPRFGDVGPSEAEVCAYDTLGNNAYSEVVVDAIAHGVAYMHLSGASPALVRSEVSASFATTTGLMSRGLVTSDDVLPLINTLMRAHEARLGVRYDGPPRIIWERLTEGYTAMYSPLDHTIALSPIVRMCNLSMLRHAETALLTYNPRSFCDIAILRQVLSHELGHHLMTALTERANGASWLDHKRLRNVSLDDKIAAQIVSEGIGVYFGYLFDGYLPQKLALPTTTTLSRNDFEKGTPATRDFYYDAGYRLVNDIIGEHGARGIEWLIMNPLIVSIPDFSGLETYRTRAHQALRTAE